MSQAFVDVKDGTRITGVFLPEQGCRFYVDGQLQHVIDDPEFARAFFSIWLDPQTAAPNCARNCSALIPEVLHETPLIVLTSLLLISCGQVPVERYANEKPVLDLPSLFSGPVQAWACSGSLR